MKKLLSLMLVLLIVLSIAGCGNKTNVATEDDESKPYEIVWYYVGAEQPEIERIETAVNEYLKDKINATVKLNSMDWGPYSQKMQNITASGEKYDISYVNGNGYTGNVYKGAYIELDEL